MEMELKIAKGIIKTPQSKDKESDLKEPQLTPPAHSKSQQEEVALAQKDTCGALVQLISAANLSVRATNVLLRNCSSGEDLNSLNEETLLSFQNCGRKTVREIVHFLNVIRIQGIVETPPSVKEQLASPPSETSLPLLPLFSSLKHEDVTVEDLHPNFCASTKLCDLDLSVRTANVLNSLNLESIGEVMLSPRTYLLKQQNFGKKSLTELEDVIKFICLSENSTSASQGSERLSIDYTSYELMLLSFIEQCEKNKRNQKLFAKRLCFQKGKVPTLEELGQHFDISRERARQILKKGTVKLHKKANLRKLSFFWEGLDRVVSKGGGLISLKELPSALQLEFNWPTAPYSLAVGQLLLFRQPAGIFKEEDDLVRVECECLSCDLPLLQLQSFDFENTESFHVQVAAAKLREHCRNVCPWRKTITTFHRAFIEHLVSKSDGLLIIFKDVLLPYERWRGKYCGNLEDVVSHVLETHGEPMHFRDIAKGIRQINKKFTEISDHNVHSAIMRYSTIEIIGRGTYGLKSWGMGGYRSVSTAIENFIDDMGQPQRKKNILQHLKGEFSELNINASLMKETRFTNIGDGFYDRPLNWQQRSCQNFIKLLPNSVADLANYLVSRNNTSYKLVMAFIFIRSMDEDGTIYLYKLRDMFYNFYLSRHKKGLVVELDTTVMSRIDELTPPEIKNKACKEPLKSFLKSGFFKTFSLKGTTLRMTEFLLTDLMRGEVRDILLLTILKDIDDYFLKISPDVVHVDIEDYEKVKDYQGVTLTTSEDEPMQQSPTISIKKKSRRKIKL